MSDLKRPKPNQIDERELAKTIRRRNLAAEEAREKQRFAEETAERERLKRKKAAEDARLAAAQRVESEKVFALARRVAELGRKHEFADWDAHYVKVYERHEDTKWFRWPVRSTRKDVVVRMVMQFNGYGLWIDINGNLLRSRTEGLKGYRNGLCRTQIGSDGLIRTVDGFSIYIDGIPRHTVIDLQKHLQYIIDSYQKRGK